MLARLAAGNVARQPWAVPRRYAEISSALRLAGDLARLYGQRITFHPRQGPRGQLGPRPALPRGARPRPHTHSACCTPVRGPAALLYTMAPMAVAAYSRARSAAHSFPPGLCSHFVKLAAPDEELAAKSMRELEAHSQVAAPVGLDPASPLPEQPAQRAPDRPAPSAPAWFTDWLNICLAAGAAPQACLRDAWGAWSPAPLFTSTALAAAAAVVRWLNRLGLRGGGSLAGHGPDGLRAGIAREQDQHTRRRVRGLALERLGWAAEEQRAAEEQHEHRVRFRLARFAIAQR